MAEAAGELFSELTRAWSTITLLARKIDNPQQAGVPRIVQLLIPQHVWWRVRRTLSPSLKTSELRCLDAFYCSAEDNDYQARLVAEASILHGVRAVNTADIMLGYFDVVDLLYAQKDQVLSVLAHLSKLAGKKRLPPITVGDAASWEAQRARIRNSRLERMLSGTSAGMDAVVTLLDGSTVKGSVMDWDPTLVSIADVPGEVLFCAWPQIRHIRLKPKR